MPTETFYQQQIIDYLDAHRLHLSKTAIRRRARQMHVMHTPVTQVGRILDMIADPTPAAACRNIVWRAGRSTDDMDAALRLGLVTA
jgi:hypothetical protein